jgi:hypothetical protein
MRRGYEASLIYKLSQKEYDRESCRKEMVTDEALEIFKSGSDIGSGPLLIRG